MALAAFAALAAAALVASTVAAPPSGADGNEAPAAPAAARYLSAGGSHACAINSTGVVRCWGSNSSGQLGQGDNNNRGDVANEMGINLLPVQLGTGRTATAISTGTDHSCALLDNASVKCWGVNSRGQLGLGSTTARGDGPNEMGDNLPAVDLGNGRTATAITAGAEHTCAILDNGAVKCWGYGLHGRLGLGDTTSRGDGPNEMGDNLPAVDLGTGRTATAVSSSYDHTCALLDNATIKCWGPNNSGALGLGDTSNRGDGPNEMGDNLPAVDLGTGRTATAISAGCALLDNATVKCWGNNGGGSLGLGDTVTRGDEPNEMGDNLPPVDLGTGRTATTISTSGSHTCAVLDDATVKCWGDNAGGELGLGDTDRRGDQPAEMGDLLPAVDLGDERTAVMVTTGNAFTCAVLNDATVRCWGRSNAGQLGRGSTLNFGDHPTETGNRLAIAVMLGGGLVGYVHSSNGDTIPGALVAALRTSDFSMAGGGVAATTGELQIPVPAGSYLVYSIDPTGANAPGFLGSPTVVNVPNQSTHIVPVLTARLGTIDGTVTETGSGNPIAGATVLTLTTGGAFEAATITDAGGNFTLPALSPGPHHVLYVDGSGGHEVRFHGGATSFDTATPVDVTAGNTAAANGVLPAQTPIGTGSAITGRVGTTPGTVVIALRANDFKFARAARTNATGGYSLNLAAGSYKLIFVDPTGRFHNEWYDDVDPADLPSATSVSAPGTANATLTPTALGQISGTITKDGEPASAAWVVAVGPTGLAGAVTESNGTYRIQGLRPDNYRAAIVHPASGRYEYWIDGLGYEDATDFQVLGGADVPLDADL